MSIEACSFLRPSLKARLQDSGVVFLDDLLPLFEQQELPGPSSRAAEEGRHGARDATGDGDSRLPLSDAMVATSPLPPSRVFLLRCDDALEHSLRRRLPLLTRDELFDLITSTTAYLASRAKHRSGRHQSPSRQSATSGPRADTCGENAERRPGGAGEPPAMASTGTAASPLFTIRTLRDIEQEMDAPSRDKPKSRRGPTHATMFCRALDNLLGAPDRVLPQPSSCSRHGRATRVVKEGGKGVEVGKITELSGPPGVGKTQMLLQLAVSCAMPVELGGLAGDCLFVDTEGSFVFERFQEIAQAAVALVRDLERRQRRVATTADGKAAPCEEVGRTDGTSMSGTSVVSSPSSSSSMVPKPSPSPTPLTLLADRFTLASILSRVHYVRAADTASFMAVLYSIPAWSAHMQHGSGDGASALDTDSPAPSPPFALKMLLVDSIAGPFRTVAAVGESRLGSGGASHASKHFDGAINGTRELATFRQRSRLLFTCGERLQAYAAGLNLAVVVSNQVTSKAARRARPSSRAAERRLEAPPTAVVGRENGSDEDLDEDEGPIQRRGGIDASRNDRVGPREDEFYTYLVPALGDTWATHVSTRVLLSYHHYALPHVLWGPGGSPSSSSSPVSAKRQGGVGEEERDQGRAAMLRCTMCPEDVVLCGRARVSRDDGRAADPHADAPPPTAATYAAQQHRVARLIKHDSNPRAECCFVISRKGIRDALH